MKPTPDEVTQLVEAVINRRQRPEHGEEEEDDADITELLRTLVYKDDGMTAAEILGQFKGKKLGWPKVQFNRLKRRADMCSKGRGIYLPWKMDFQGASTPPHRYNIRIVRNVGPMNVSGLWWPHLWTRHSGEEKARETAVVVTEPVFFRHTSDKYYVRHFGVNDPQVSALQQMIPGLAGPPTSFIYAPHYVSIGEVRAANAIMDGIRQINPGVPMTFLSHRNHTYSAFRENNLVALGTSRANDIIMEFQQKEKRLHYWHHSDGLMEVGPQALTYEDKPGKAYYGLFTRIADRGTRRVTSVIACNYGPATQVIADYLLKPVTVKELASKMGIDKNWNGFPEHFQLVFKATLSSDGDESVLPEAELVLPIVLK